MLYDFLTGCPGKDFQEAYPPVNDHCHSLSEPCLSGCFQRIPGYTVMLPRTRNGSHKSILHVYPYNLLWIGDGH